MRHPPTRAIATAVVGRTIGNAEEWRAGIRSDDRLSPRVGRDERECFSKKGWWGGQAGTGALSPERRRAQMVAGCFSAMSA